MKFAAITKGLPQTGIQGGAGVGVFYLHRMLASKVAFLQNNPLAAPLGFIVLGHVLKKSPKLSTVAAALIGAGGYAGAQAYELKKGLAAIQATQAANAPANTAGFEDDDTGAVTTAADIGALLSAADVGDVYDNSSAYADAYSL